MDCLQTDRTTYTDHRTEKLTNLQTDSRSKLRHMVVTSISGNNILKSFIFVKTKGKIHDLAFFGLLNFVMISIVILHCFEYTIVTPLGKEMAFAEMNHDLCQKYSICCEMEMTIFYDVKLKVLLSTVAMLSNFIHALFIKTYFSLNCKSRKGSMINDQQCSSSYQVNHRSIITIILWLNSLHLGISVHRYTCTENTGNKRESKPDTFFHTDINLHIPCHAPQYNSKDAITLKQCECRFISIILCFNSIHFMIFGFSLSENVKKQKSMCLMKVKATDFPLASLSYRHPQKLIWLTWAVQATKTIAKIIISADIKHEIIQFTVQIVNKIMVFRQTGWKRNETHAMKVKSRFFNMNEKFCTCKKYSTSNLLKEHDDENRLLSETCSMNGLLRKNKCQTCVKMISALNGNLYKSPLLKTLFSISKILVLVHVRLLIDTIGTHNKPLRVKKHQKTHDILHIVQVILVVSRIMTIYRSSFKNDLKETILIYKYPLWPS